MNRETPIWMMLLIALFGITTAASFGSLIFVHVQKSSREEELFRLKRLKTRLIEDENRLNQVVDGLKSNAETDPPPPIVARRKQLEWMKTKVDEYSADIKTRLMSDNDNLVAVIGEAIDEQIRKFADWYKQCQDAQANVATELENALKTEMRIDHDHQILRKEVAAMAQSLEELKRDQRDEIKDLDDKIATLTERHEELVDRTDIKRDDLVSDGILLEARASAGFVVINRGIQDNLRRGTAFTVYNRRGGENIRKGRIEVVTLYPHMAECRVLHEADANDPLIPGDHIHNPIYNPDEIKVFVVKGDFKRYNRDELEYFIRSVGGEVQQEVTVQTHYLVVGDGAEEAVRAAKLRGVTILSEEKLLEFVRAPARSRISRGMTFVLRGTFDRVPRDAIEDFLLSSGGVIHDEIDSSVDALIAGADCVDDIIKARASGIEVILQEDLINLSGPSEDR